MHSYQIKQTSTHQICKFLYRDQSQKSRLKSANQVRHIIIPIFRIMQRGRPSQNSQSEKNQRMVQALKPNSEEQLAEMMEIIKNLMVTVKSLQQGSNKLAENSKDRDDKMDLLEEKFEQGSHQLAEYVKQSNDKMEQLEEKFEASQNSINGLNDELRKTKVQLMVLENQLGQLKAEVIDIRSELFQTKSELTKLGVQLTLLSFQLRKTNAQMRKLKGELQLIKVELRDIKKQIIESFRKMIKGSPKKESCSGLNKSRKIGVNDNGIKAHSEIKVKRIQNSTVKSPNKKAKNNMDSVKGKAKSKKSSKQVSQSQMNKFVERKSKPQRE